MQGDTKCRAFLKYILSAILKLTRGCGIVELSDIIMFMQTSIHPSQTYNSPCGVSTLLLGAGDGCSQRTLPAIPGSLRTLEQVWLLSLAVDRPPMELGHAWTKQGNCTCMTWDPGGGSMSKQVTFTNLNFIFLRDLESLCTSFFTSSEINPAAS